MNGDLSLSQSFGGLRIANPDDEAASSPVAPALASADSLRPSISSQSSGSTVKEQPRTHALPDLVRDQPRQEPAYRTQQGDLGGLPRRPSTRVRATSGASDQTSSSQRMHYQGSYQAAAQQGNQAMQYPSSASYASHLFSPASSNPSTRPIYNHSNISTGSAASSSGSYRYGDEMQQQQQQQASGVSRNSSRRAAAPGARAHPSREASKGERAYRQAAGQAQQASSGNGVVLPRKSSRRVPGHSAAATGYNASPYTIEGGPLPSSEDWQERGAAVSTRREVDANGNPVSRVVKKGVRDFNFGRTLGEGSYSTVLAATDRQTLREFAIKVLDKRHIIKERKVKYVNIEKDTLNRLTDHPGIVRLYYTFQDERSLYFVLDLASGGELLGVLKKMGTFDEDCARFYGAQILDSIAYMHSKGVIHRDLKPENVLLDDQMHTKITDFGTAKILNLRDGQDAGNESAGDPLDGADTDRAVSFVGTAEYVSPELLTDKNACKASDLWAFGCIVYQLLAGRPPFKASNEYQTFQKIVALDYTFPDGFPQIARDLIERLLVLDPAQRLPIDSIRRHPFFDGIQWGRDLWKQKAPRLKPYVPPAAEPIKLNGQGLGSSYPTTIPGVPSVTGTPPQAAGSQCNGRPQLRAITELPPPSQLDIDWSPVLTRNNERILKLGNLNVTSTAGPHSPTSTELQEEKKKFSRFFGGGTPKKRERLVLITSSARVIIAAAGGDEKKAKMEISLLSPTASYKTFQDAKGLTAFTVDLRDKHFTFEDPRATTSDPDGSKYSAQEWMESIERAKELAMSHPMATSYSGSSQYNELASSLSSPSSAGGGDLGNEPTTSQYGHGRLRKEPSDNDSVKGRKNRFSKRQSKSGLAAVF